MSEGEWVKGAISGIEVEGYWTGRGMVVQRFDRAEAAVLVPLTTWSQETKMTEALFIGKHFIQVGGEYMLDGDPVAVPKW